MNELAAVPDGISDETGPDPLKLRIVDWEEGREGTLEAATPPLPLVVLDSQFLQSEWLIGWAIWRKIRQNCSYLCHFASWNLDE